MRMHCYGFISKYNETDFITGIYVQSFCTRNTLQVVLLLEFVAKDRNACSQQLGYH